MCGLPFLHIIDTVLPNKRKELFCSASCYLFLDGFFMVALHCVFIFHSWVFYYDSIEMIRVTR